MHNSHAQRLHQNTTKYAECKKILKKESRSGGSGSGLVMTKYHDEIWLPWHMMGHAMTAVESILLNKCGQYKEEVSGVVLAFGDIEFGNADGAPEQMAGTAVVNSEPVLPFEFVCQTCVFKPEIGGKYSGMITQCNEHSVIANVHGRFHCHVNKGVGHHKKRDKIWQNLAVGQNVQLEVTAIKIHNRIMQLHAVLGGKISDVDLTISASTSALFRTPNNKNLQRVVASNLNESTSSLNQSGSRLNLSSLFTPSTLKPKVIKLDDEGDRTESEDDLDLPGTSTQQNHVNHVKADANNNLDTSSSLNNNNNINNSNNNNNNINNNNNTGASDTDGSSKKSRKSAKKKSRKRKRTRTTSGCSSVPNEDDALLGDRVLDKTDVKEVQLVNGHHNDGDEGELAVPTKHKKHKKKHKRMKLDLDAND